MGELAALFDQMNHAVLAQEPTVMQINDHSENMQNNLEGANTHLDGAIEKAKARNRKKWYCLGIGSGLPQVHRYDQVRS